MYASPIFSAVLDSRREVRVQCQECRDMGWPVGMFTCAGDNLDCIDF